MEHMQMKKKTIVFSTNSSETVANMQNNLILYLVPYIKLTLSRLQT